MQQQKNMVNLASEKELLDIQGVASRSAEVIVSVRNYRGSQTLDSLQTILRKRLTRMKLPCWISRQMISYR
jgi:hypothetical protein